MQKAVHCSASDTARYDRRQAGPGDKTSRRRPCSSARRHTRSAQCQTRHSAAATVIVLLRIGRASLSLLCRLALEPEGRQSRAYDQAIPLGNDPNGLQDKRILARGGRSRFDPPKGTYRPGAAPGRCDRCRVQRIQARHDVTDRRRYSLGAANRDSGTKFRLTRRPAPAMRPPAIPPPRIRSHCRVVSAAIILAEGPAKFGEHDDHRVVPGFPHFLLKTRQSLAQAAQPV